MHQYKTEIRRCDRQTRRCDREIRRCDRQTRRFNRSQCHVWHGQATSRASAQLQGGRDEPHGPPSTRNITARITPHMVGMSWSSSSCVQGVPSALMRCKDELGRKEWMSSGSWRLCLPIQCRLYTAAAVCTVHSLSAETAPRVNATAENASLPELCMSETSNLFKCLGLKKRFS